MYPGKIDLFFFDLSRPNFINKFICAQRNASNINFENKLW